jgi:hypothetical protein
VLFSCVLIRCQDDPEAPNPAISENGDIAFASDREGTARIYIMDEHGKNQRKVTDDAVIHVQGEEYYGPAFSHSGGFIAFVVNPKRVSSAQFGIGTVKPDGSGKKLLGSGVTDLQLVNQISPPSVDDAENVLFAAGDPNSHYYYKHDDGVCLRVEADWCFPISGYSCSQYFSPAAARYPGDLYSVILGTGSKIIKVDYMTGAVETLLEIGKNQNPNFD